MCKINLVMYIAEIGLNHLGSTERLKKYINYLISTNVDGITIQIREKSYYEKNKDLIINSDVYSEIIDRTKKNNKKFGVAIADIDMIEFFESNNVDFYKVIRNDINNKKLIDRLVLTKKKLIVSTGTSSDNELQNFISNYSMHNITINHTQLSNNIDGCNLKAISNLKQKYNIDVSYGSHSQDITVLYMSLCFEPSDILFYVKDNENLKFPDNDHAVSINNVGEVVENLIYLERAIGTGKKEKMEIKI